MKSIISLVVCGIFLGAWARPSEGTFQILWTNRDDSGFDEDELRVMDAGISMWESVITDMDGDPTTADVFRLQIIEIPDLSWPARALNLRERNGLPFSGRVEFDDGLDMPAPFRELYVEPEPFANDAFEATVLPHYLLAEPGTPADAAGTVDVLNAILHEIGHAIGFASAYSRWRNAVQDDLTIDYGSGKVRVRGFHNWPEIYPDIGHLSCDSNAALSTSLDLMCSSLTLPSHATRDRRFISELDLQLLESVYGYTVNYDGLIAGPSGDFDQNGVLNVVDLDLLTLELDSSDAADLFDLNFDEHIDGNDRRVWIKNFRQTWFGDANLDGEFNSGDLVQVFQLGEYEDGVPLNSGWSGGDFDGDGDFASGDFVVAFQDGGYELGAVTPIAAVPEPSVTCLMMIAGWAIGLRLDRQRKTFIQRAEKQNA